MKQLVDAHGWPGRSLVGADGAHAAWLLAQHSDHDPIFQKACLKLLRAAWECGEAEGRHVAYLNDRICVSTGRPQVYGTQYLDLPDGNGYQPHETADLDRVDERRAAMGMEPLAEYDQLYRRYREGG